MEQSGISRSLVKKQINTGQREEKVGTVSGLDSGNYASIGKAKFISGWRKDKKGEGAKAENQPILKPMLKNKKSTVKKLKNMHVEETKEKTRPQLAEALSYC